MKEIIEEKTRYGIKYNIYYNKRLVKKVNIIRAVSKINNYDYILLFDSKGQVINEVLEYLNFICVCETINTREQYAGALKLLYSYSEIIDKNIEDFLKEDYYNLSIFISGRNYSGDSISITNENTRKNITHNLYLSALRKYFSWMGLDNNYIVKKSEIGRLHNGYGMFAHTKTIKGYKFISNLKVKKNSEKKIPKYISVEEFHIIVSFIEESNGSFSKRNMLMISLMFKTGMRLGEILGLSLEDISNHPDDCECGLIIIRNRLSDAKDQRAKGCMKIISKDDYTTESYVEEDIGYESIPLPRLLYKELKEYIELSRNLFLMSNINIQNLMNSFRADVVEGIRNENFYLFLNKNNRPLTASGWSKELKKIYIGVGISIDENRKKDNLSHRLRHGYAMFLIEKMKMEPIEVKRKMRHTSLSSTLLYYNPKPEKILESSNAIEKCIENEYLGGKNEKK